MDKRINLFTNLVKIDALNDRDGDITGIEIRLKRLAQSKTLDSLADNLCSVSYLSKIETNKIKPNKMILNEICERLDITGEKVNVLLKLKEVLWECTNNYAFEKTDVIDKYYYDGLGLKNFRYGIVEFIYYIAHKEYSKASEVEAMLLEVSSSMLKFDLEVLMTFSGILAFYKHEYQVSFSILEKLARKTNNNVISFLADKFSFYSLISLNDYNCYEYYDRLRTYLLGRGIFDLYEKYTFYYCLYLLRNKKYRIYQKFLKMINNKKYVHQLILLSRLIMQSKMMINPKWVDEFDYYFKALFYVFTDQDKAIRFLKSNRCDDDYFYCYTSIINYLLLSSDVDKFCYIYNVLIPSIIKNNEGYLKDFFLNELSAKTAKTFKYKMFNEAYIKLKGIGNEEINTAF